MSQRNRVSDVPAVGLLGRNVAGRLGKALDPLLDIPERFQAGFIQAAACYSCLEPG
jgi:hypothetical protein